MKLSPIFVCLLAVGLAVGEAGRAWSADETVLTRPQWLRKIGDSVKQESVLRGTLSQIAPEERVF